MIESVVKDGVYKYVHLVSEDCVYHNPSPHSAVMSMSETEKVEANVHSTSLLVNWHQQKRMRNRQAFVGVLFLGHQLPVPLIVECFISVHFISQCLIQRQWVHLELPKKKKKITQDSYVMSGLLLEPKISQSLTEF